MHACAMKQWAKMWKARYGRCEQQEVLSNTRLVLVEDRRRPVRVKVLDVDQQQGVRVLERQPQATRAVGERDVRVRVRVTVTVTVRVTVRVSPNPNP